MRTIIIILIIALAIIAAIIVTGKIINNEPHYSDPYDRQGVRMTN